MLSAASAALPAGFCPVLSVSCQKERERKQQWGGVEVGLKGEWKRRRRRDVQRKDLLVHYGVCLRDNRQKSKTEVCEAALVQVIILQQQVRISFFPMDKVIYISQTLSSGLYCIIQIRITPLVQSLSQQRCQVCFPALLVTDLQTVTIN